MHSVRKQAAPRGDESVFTLIHRVARSLSRGSMSFYLDRYGIGLPHMQIIHTVANHGPLPSTGIVELTGMNKSLASRTLGQLTEDGFTIDLADSGDARKRVWTLTPKGKAFVEEVAPVLQERRVKILNALSQGERALLPELLKRLLEMSEDLREQETLERRRGKPRKDDAFDAYEGDMHAA